MKNKVVFCGGSYGDSFSTLAYNWLRKHGWTGTDINDIPRHDPLLVECVEKLGPMASNNGGFKIANIDENMYIIDELDGMERVLTPKDFNWIKIETL